MNCYVEYVGKDYDALFKRDRSAWRSLQMKYADMV